MTLCPIAIAVGCKKCPVFKLCPVKGLLGDQPKTSAAPADTKPSPAPARKAGQPTKPRSVATKRTAKSPVKSAGKSAGKSAKRGEAGQDAAAK